MMFHTSILNSMGAKWSILNSLITSLAPPSPPSSAHSCGRGRQDGDAVCPMPGRGQPFAVGARGAG